MIGRKFGYYRIVSLIGEGGVGEVYEAIDDSTNRRVAMKFATLPSSQSATRVKHFSKASEYLLRMSHPKLVRGIEFKKFGQRFCLVMELATQGSLADLIDKQGPIAEEEGIKIIFKVVQGLIYIHSCGLIHRDIKPHNILLFENNITKISDFDLFIPMGGKSRQKSVLPSGSPCYMPPEQIRREELTATSDIYALGVTMYEMFVGKPPFSGNVHEIMGKTLSLPPLPPRKLNDQLSPFLEKIILKCMEKKSTQRFSSLENLEQSLSFE